jgi:hypothetical protein
MFVQKNPSWVKGFNPFSFRLKSSKLILTTRKGMTSWQNSDKEITMSHLPKVLLTEYQASDAIGLKVATLRKRRWQGLAPRFLKVGSKVFYDQNDIQDYLNSCIRQSTSDQGEG